MEQSDFRTPLLDSVENGDLENPDDVDVGEMISCNDLRKEWWIESKKLWSLAGPIIFTTLCQQTLVATTQIFAGHLGTLNFAAISISNSVIGGFAFGVMMGMGSAVETVCGQAMGTGKLNMLGLYLQRSWVILTALALPLTLTYVFVRPILRALGQTDEVAEAAGNFAPWLIPQLYAFAINYPVARFLQSQGRVIAMSLISGSALVVHVLFSWLLIVKLGWGLVGAALMLDLSWWIVVIGQIGYVFSGACGDSWTGFSWSAFHNLGGLLRLSLASAIMMSADLMYMMVLILAAGHLKHPEIAIDTVSICLNVVFWIYMLYLGFNVAIGVRVSNELGSGRPKAAKIAIIVAMGTSLVIGLIFMAIILLTKNEFPMFFTDNMNVAKQVSKLATVLSFAVLLNDVQFLLTGVAIGAGWQTFVAYLNIGCYYILGVPLGILLGFKFDLGVKGMWTGMICGSGLQTLVLCISTIRTNWEHEASQAENRIKIWGGAVTPQWPLW